MMLWGKDLEYQELGFEKERELEEALQEVTTPLFGTERIYLDVKRRIGAKHGTQNVPDGYLIDLTSKKEPRLYVVENELAKHDPLKHIAVQILEFSLSFETTPHKVKGIIKAALQKIPAALKKCEAYAAANGFENVDYLLERLVYESDSFNALVIIDDVSEELEKALLSRFKFPVEIITLQRYANADGERLYAFDPFLEDVALDGGSEPLDPSEIDTIVVPARDEGFEEVFLGEDRWYQIRIHASMIPRIRHIAVYRVAPTSSITHIAPVRSIERWEDSAKYVVNFEEPAHEIKPIRLRAKGRVKAPQGPRYTSMARLETAKTLDDAF